MLRKKEGVIFLRISDEFFNVFPCKLKARQYMSGVFSLLAGLLSDIMEEFELKFSFAAAGFWVAFFFFQYYKHGFHLEYFLDDSLILEVMLESDFTFSFAIAEFIISGFSIKCESKPSTVGLLNISFFVNNLHYNSFYEISAFISSGHSS